MGQDFLKFGARERVVFYEGKKPWRLVNELFGMLAEQAASASEAELVLDHRALRRLGDTAELAGKELKRVLDRAAEQLDAWSSRSFRVRLDNQNVVVTVTFDAGHRNHAWTLKATFSTANPDQCSVREGGDEVSVRTCLDYLAWLERDLAESKHSLDSIYLPVDSVTLPGERHQTRAPLDDGNIGTSALRRGWAQVRIETSAIAVVAPAGAGKTSLLRHEAVEICHAGRAAISEGRGAGRTLVPTYFRLSTLARLELQQPINELDWLRQALIAHGFPLSLAEGVHSIRRACRFIFLLDGLDEVPWDRRDVAEALLLSLADHGFQVMFSSRVESYSFASPKVRQLYREVAIPPFEIPDAIRYIEERFSQQPAERTIAARLARTSAFSNPLLLALLCNAIEESSAAATLGRPELFERVVRSWLAGSWRELDHVEKRVRDRLVDAKLNALERVAITIADHPRKVMSLGRMSLEDQLLSADPHRILAASAAPQSVVDILVDGDGVLVRTGQNPPVYEFLHSTIWAYFVARHISKGDYSIALERSWFDAAWADVVVFLAGMVADKTALLSDLASDPDVFHDRLFLQLRCLAEITPHQVDGQLAKRIVDGSLALLMELAGEDRHPELPLWLASAGPFVFPEALRLFNLNPTGPTKVVRLLADTSEDSRGPSAILRAFSDSSEYVGLRYGLAPAAARFFGPEFVDGLIGPGIERPMHEEAAEYLATCLRDAYGRTLPARVLQRLLAVLDATPPQTIDYHVWIIVLCFFDNDEAENRVLAFATDDRQPFDDRILAITHLLFSKSGSHSSDLTGFFALLSDDFMALLQTLAPRTMREALDALSLAPDAEMRLLASVLRARTADDKFVQKAARDVLASGSARSQLYATTLLRDHASDLALAALDMLSRDEDALIRSSAIHECMRFGRASADIVLSRFLDKDRHVRHTAFRVAGNLRLVHAVAHLSFVAESKESDDSDAAAEALAMIGSAESLPLIIGRVNEGRDRATALVRFRDPQVLELLINRWLQVTSAPAQVVRDAIAAEDLAGAIGDLGQDAAVRPLLGAVSRFNPSIRGAIWSSCDRLMTSRNATEVSVAVLDAVECLLKEYDTNSDGSEHLRDGKLTSFELATLGGLLRRAAPSVSRALAKEEWRVWRDRCRTLVAIQPRDSEYPLPVAVATG